MLQLLGDNNEVSVSEGYLNANETQIERHNVDLGTMESTIEKFTLFECEMDVKISEISEIVSE